MNLLFIKPESGMKPAIVCITGFGSGQTDHRVGLQTNKRACILTPDLPNFSHFDHWRRICIANQPKVIGIIRSLP